MGNEEPLIWTIKGNLPIASLERKDGWELGDNAIVYWEEYWLGDELVKRGCAVRLLKPVDVGLEQAEMG